MVLAIALGLCLAFAALAARGSRPPAMTADRPGASPASTAPATPTRLFSPELIS